MCDAVSAPWGREGAGPRRTRGVSPEKNLIECPGRRGGRAADRTGLENQLTPAANLDKDRTSNTSAPVLASCLALLSETIPDLARIVQVWPSLPEAFRQALLALIEVNENGRGQP
jgi:hypothetical protein